MFSTRNTKFDHSYSLRQADMYIPATETVRHIMMLIVTIVFFIFITISSICCTSEKSFKGSSIEELKPLKLFILNFRFAD